ncbi:hypothetical protein ONZ45_g19505 [Pleurotus djamor]|nr:hypothetical protein ONZ45_g19505 [Pleurotus djamor]
MDDWNPLSPRYTIPDISAKNPTSPYRHDENHPPADQVPIAQPRFAVGLLTPSSLPNTPTPLQNAQDSSHSPSRSRVTEELPIRHDGSIPSSNPRPPPNARSEGQRRRRERERQERENASWSGPTLVSLPSTPQPSANARSEGQRRRRERERQERANARETASALVAQPSRLPTLVNAHSEREHQERGIVDNAPGPQPEMEIDTQQVLPPPPLPLTPRSQPPRTRTSDLFLIARKPYTEPASRHELGPMNDPCARCGALHWKTERLASSRKSRQGVFGMCCDSGQVVLPPLRDPPHELRLLFEGNDDQAAEFRTNIRAYNAALAFTSLGVSLDSSVNEQFGGQAWVFRIHGQLHHNSAALQPAPGRSPCYAQLYLYDPQIALQLRMYRNSDQRHETMAVLQRILLLHHRYVPVFRQAFEILASYEHLPNLEIRLRVQLPQTRRNLENNHPRRYNLPTVDEVAMIIPSGPTDYDFRDIVLHQKGGGLRRISEGHPAYLPLHYVLFFPYGEHGWHNGLRKVDPDTRHPTPTSKALSLTRFAAYRIQVRPAEYSLIHRGGRLFQQLLVDLWASAEQQRLHWLRTHQSEIRASLYSGLQDALAHDGQIDLSQLGRRYILPSSFIGGARHMQQRFQDAMAIARKFRKVDLFITVTANPHWDEITCELLPGQTSYDRPDLVSRVFELKKKAIIEDIYKHGIFGHAVAYVYVIEFQKRGLPHAHILITRPKRSVGSFLSSTVPRRKCFGALSLICGFCISLLFRILSAFSASVFPYPVSLGPFRDNFAFFISF